MGLIVYGHKGSNQDSGKTESCAGVEWAHPMGTMKRDVAASIADLAPNGWTPLDGALDFAKSELERMQIKGKSGEESQPVVYLIFDGEETCGGDPVASATALHESGVRAAVNVIGFDVNDEVRAQLEAISEAGGGKYFAAQDSKALRAQLNAAQESINSRAL